RATRICRDVLTSAPCLHIIPLSSPSSFLTAAPSSETFTLSLHDALPISGNQLLALQAQQLADLTAVIAAHSRAQNLESAQHAAADRKSTRLNSSHVKISYAVFCLTKKNAN